MVSPFNLPRLGVCSGAITHEGRCSASQSSPTELPKQWLVWVVCSGCIDLDAWEAWVFLGYQNKLGYLVKLFD